MCFHFLYVFPGVAFGTLQFIAEMELRVSMEMHACS
jgi:hypothetical protein